MNLGDFIAVMIKIRNHNPELANLPVRVVERGSLTNDIFRKEDIVYVTNAINEVLIEI